MAYYTSTIVPTSIRTSNLDPTVEAATWLSDHLETWASLAGAGVTFLKGRNDWTGSLTNTSDHPIVVQLDSPHYLNGDYTGPAMGLSFELYTYWMVRAWEGHNPTSSNGGTGTFDRQVNVTYNSNYNHGSANNYNQGYDWTVAYSDTPGKRFFSWWQFTGSSSSALRFGGVFEVQNASHVSSSENFAWVLYEGDKTSYPITRSHSSETLSKYQSQSSAWSMGNSLTGDNTLLKNIPIYAGTGEYLGYVGEDQMLESRTGSRSGSQIRNISNNKYYLSNGTYYYVRIA